MCNVQNACLDSIDGNWAGILFEFVLFLYSFYGVAVVCDNHLVASLETLCLKFHIPEDVAGASFMAFGSAAPEIIISAVSTLKSATTTDNSDNSITLSIGAILGSGMIAFMAIPGCCGIFSGVPLELKRRPLLRDISFYLIAILCLCQFFNDGVIDIVEAATLVSIYVIYIIVLLVAPVIRRVYRRKFIGLEPAPFSNFVAEARRSVAQVRRTSLLDSATAEEKELAALEEATVSANRERAPTGEYMPPSAGINVAGEQLNTSSTGLLSIDTSQEEPAANSEELQLPEVDSELSSSKIMKIVRIMVLPLDKAFSYTCVPCEMGTPWENFWPATFFVAFLWISLFSFLIAAIMERWCSMWNVSDEVGFFGTAIVAIGAEIPDMIQSVTVARKGYGSMAVSNSIGSQICNILIGLGFIWMITILSGGKVIVHDPSSLQFTAYLQTGIVCISFISLLGVAFIRKQKKAILNMRRGIFFLVVYGISLIVLACKTFI